MPSRPTWRTLELEDFCERYFAERADADPFAWAARRISPKRSATMSASIQCHGATRSCACTKFLRLIVPHLDAEEYRRFARHFKPVFVDDYATVPHESIQRMLALHGAGKLDVFAIGDDYRIDSHRPEGGASVAAVGERHIFPIFIEATGQRPLQAKSFPVSVASATRHCARCATWGVCEALRAESRSTTSFIPSPTLFQKTSSFV
jgi:hypothetical protein